MWIAGVVLLFVGAAVLAALLRRLRRPGVLELPWDIPDLSGPYTGVLGMLADFNVASVIFIANLMLCLRHQRFPKWPALSNHVIREYFFLRSSQEQPCTLSKRTLFQTLLMATVSV